MNPVYLRLMATRRDDPMPMDYTKYPPDWKDISFRIRSARAKWRCEWCGAKQGERNPVTLSVVILTVTHLGVDQADGTPGDKADKMDCRDENLAALCQRCHLNYDRADHLETQRLNRLAKEARNRETAGQLPLI
jgi:hypothetical protein